MNVDGSQSVRVHEVGIKSMFMEDEHVAAINATVTSRQALLDNNPHFIFLHKHTEPVFLIMI